MGDLRVRNLDDALVVELRDRARREGTSVPGLVRRILDEECRRRRDGLIAELADLQESIRLAHGTLPDSTPGIRAERDGLEC